MNKETREKLMKLMDRGIKTNSYLVYKKQIKRINKIFGANGEELICLNKGKGKGRGRKKKAPKETTDVVVIEI